MEKSQSHPESEPTNDTPAPAAASDRPAEEAVATWPGAFGLYKPSSRAVQFNLNAFLLLWALSIVGGVVIGAIFGHHRLLTNLISTIFGAFTSAAVIYVTLASVRGQAADFTAALRAAWPRFLWFFVLQLFVGLTVIGGLILLIVPGLYFAVRLSLAGYFFMDQNLSVGDAYKASWAATKGHMGKVWGIVGVCFLMILPALTIIGIVVTIYLLFMYQAAMGLLYVHLQPEKLATKE